ncbi:MAG: CRTAC1 family protein [Acidobacteriota bacterium]
MSSESAATRLRFVTLASIVVLASASACTPERSEQAPQPTSAAEARAPAADAATAPALFTDEATASGLDFQHWNGMTGKLYFAEMMGSGAALFDYDNDGDLDVFLVQGNLLSEQESEADALVPPLEPLPLRDRLFRNDLTIAADGTRNLRFTDVTEESGLSSEGYGMGVTAADFDNDGWTDLYVTNLNGNRMFRNLGVAGDGGPRFEDVTERSGTGSQRWSVPAVAFDFDRDGWLDLFVGNYVDYSVAANKRCTDELGVPNDCGPLSFPPVPDLLLRNRGDGTFEDVSRVSGIRGEYGGCLGAVVADFNGDGWPDLYVANDGLPNQLWMHRGPEIDGASLSNSEAIFENRSLLAGTAVSGQGHPEASMGVAVGDFDADGDEDLFLTHLKRETNTLYVNDGRGQFHDRSAVSGLGSPSYASTGFGTGWLDYDNDGWLDLLTVNGAVKVIKTQRLAGETLPLHQPNQLFRHLGPGASSTGASPGPSFEEVTAAAGAAFELSEVSRGAAFGDVDNDGDTDVVINNNNGPVRLLINRVGQDRPWLGLRLVDAAGEIAVQGAAAAVSLGERTLWRRVGATASYASASDSRLLFGLGEATSITQIIVHWPDGTRERWDTEPIRLNAYNTLRRGSGQAWDGE